MIRIVGFFFLIICVALSACFSPVPPSEMVVNPENYTFQSKDQISLEKVFSGLSDQADARITAMEETSFPPVIKIQHQEQRSARSNLSALGAAKPRLETRQPTFNFGYIHEGDTVDHVFRIYNRGPGVWKIEEALPSCGCTAAVPTKMVVGVGEFTEIAVQFKSKGLPGFQLKLVEVFSNADYLKLSLEGIVYPPNFNPTPQSAESGVPENPPA